MPVGMAVAPRGPGIDVFYWCFLFCKPRGGLHVVRGVQCEPFAVAFGASSDAFFFLLQGHGSVPVNSVVLCSGIEIECKTVRELGAWRKTWPRREGLISRAEALRA